MGNYRFRLSDMIPNSWLYKLKDMSSKANKPHPISYSTGTKTQVKKKPLPTSSPATKHTYRYLTTDQPTKDSAKPVLSSTHFATPARKSAKKKRRPINNPSSSSTSPSPTSKKLSATVSAGCGFAASMDSVWKSETHQCRHPSGDGSRQYYIDHVQSSLSSSCSCRVTTSTSSSSDILAVDMEKTGKIGVGFSDSISASNCKKYTRRLDSVLLDSVSIVGDFGSKIDVAGDEDHIEKKCGLQPPVELPPISTKQAKYNLHIKNREGEAGSKSKLNLSKMETEIFHSHNNPVKSSPARRSTSSQGLRIRPSSPRLASKKIQSYTRRSRLPTAGRKGVSESFAVMKSSSDPHRDFRESMVEMIVENNLSASKDLEDLLACYLSLNSDEYHGVIVKVFEQIWFDFTDLDHPL